jgi:endonuclease-3 related protein
MPTYRQIHDKLLKYYGPQHWWPAKTPFEVMVGAILTQNTAWTNVEKAIANLRQAKVLNAQAIADLPADALAELIRPSGYFNIKAKRLQNFCRWYLAQGGLKALQQRDTTELRHALLSVNGVGPETADDMLVYAFERPVFVIDAYTRRLFSRIGLIGGDEGYEHLREQVEQAFVRDKSRLRRFNELHALIVIHAKAHCRKQPACKGCPLSTDCQVGRDEKTG